MHFSKLQEGLAQRMFIMFYEQNISQ